MNMKTAKQPVQASRLSRWLRRASAAGEDSRPSRGSALPRAGSRPLPRSRRAASRAAVPSSSTLAAAGSRSTAGRAPVNGRSSSAQPSGVAQRSQPAPLAVSATARSSRNSATAPPPSSRATRRDGASWLATAPSPANTGITETVARAR